MHISTTGTLPATSVTTIDDWQPFLEKRTRSQRWLLAIPLELRLILITTTIVLILVAAGAQIASVIGGQQAFATGQRLHTAPAAMRDGWQPDGICSPASATNRMISAAQLASGHTPGAREIQPGIYRTCQANGLSVPTPMVGIPASGGQMILVSLSQQWLWAYQDGALVFANPVATGMPYLRTPQGVFHIQYKVANTTFYSPWPRWSRFYYTPEHVNYALHFRAGGFYIHDAPWRQMYGPGAEDPHTTPTGDDETGSHGCVNMTTSAAAWLYQWAHLGATVQIVE